MMQMQFIKVGGFFINLAHITHIRELPPECYPGKRKHNGRLRIFLHSIVSTVDGVDVKTISFPSESPEAAAIHEFFNHRAQDLTSIDEATYENAIADLRPY